MHRKLALGFYRLDLTKDGLNSHDDFESLGKQVAAQLQNGQSAARAEQIVQAFITLWEVYFKPADRDGDDAVSFDELVAARETRLQAPNAHERLAGVNAALFAALDIDGDGRLSPQEYSAFLTPMGVSAADAQTAFQHLDRDGDGFISDNELAEAWWEYWTSEDRAAPGNWVFGSY